MSAERWWLVSMQSHTIVTDIFSFIFSNFQVRHFWTIRPRPIMSNLHRDTFWLDRERTTYIVWVPFEAILPRSSMIAASHGVNELRPPFIFHLLMQWLRDHALPTSQWSCLEAEGAHAIIFGKALIALLGHPLTTLESTSNLEFISLFHEIVAWDPRYRVRALWWSPVLL